MSALPPKPGLLMFLQGLLALFAFGNFFSIFISVRGALGEIRAGDLSLNTLSLAFAVITVGLTAPAVHLINKAKARGRLLGILSFAFLAVRAVATAIWFVTHPNPLLGKYFTATSYIAFMVVQALLCLAAAAAFGLSTPIKLYFHPEHQPTDSPPPPPDFTDEAPSPASSPPEHPSPTTPRDLPIE